MIPTLSKGSALLSLSLNNVYRDRGFKEAFWLRKEVKESLP
jgi:hypothetical protein